MVNGRRTAVRAARIAVLGALLYASQVCLSFLPNVEIVTLLIVIFTRRLGKDGTAACFVYVCLTALTWGFGIWWFTYLAVWPLFSLLVYILRKCGDPLVWAIINGGFGLCFGALFAIPYIFVSPAYAFSYWVSGIPFDIVHCAGNFAAALLLFKPLDSAMKRVMTLQKK
ncbi:MAG: hypothetical protein NC093_01455 [Alistipes sp.]|nr:hypothetical protein [Alistipes sp.]